MFVHFLACAASEDVKQAVRTACDAPFCDGTSQVRVIQSRTCRFSGSRVVLVTGFHQGRPLQAGAMGLVVVPRDTGRVLCFYHAGELGEGWELL